MNGNRLAGRGGHRQLALAEHHSIALQKTDQTPRDAASYEANRRTQLKTEVLSIDS
jgi:hypothetical protein